MKKAVAALTALLLCALLAVPCSAADIRYVRGDADRDGAVTIHDVTAIQRRLAQFSMTEFDETAADIDGGGLSVNDATLIQSTLALLGNPYRIGETVLIPSGGDDEDLPPMPDE